MNLLVWRGRGGAEADSVFRRESLGPAHHLAVREVDGVELHVAGCVVGHLFVLRIAAREKSHPACRTFIHLPLGDKARTDGRSGRNLKLATA
jgi:hypothetical protein